MAKDDPQALCDRLFDTFLAPLVLGGTMKPGKPIGGKNALALSAAARGPTASGGWVGGPGRAPSDNVTLSLVDLARVRVARRVAAVDRFDQAPTAAEWAIAAMV